MFTVSFLSAPPTHTDTHSSHHHTLTHPVGSIHSTPPTKPNHPPGPSGSLLAWVLWGCWGGRHWLSPCNELLRDSVWFHHSRNCSRGALDPMKTNKSKYQELIRGLFGFGPPPGPHFRVLPYLYIATKWLCIIALMRTTLKNLREVFLFFPSLLLDKCVHP